MREIWRPAKDFEGLYEVSNMGSVKRVATSGGKGTGNYARGEHVLSQRKNNVGYKIVDAKGNWCFKWFYRRLFAWQEK